MIRRGDAETGGTGGSQRRRPGTGIRLVVSSRGLVLELYSRRTLPTCSRRIWRWWCKVQYVSATLKQKILNEIVVEIIRSDVI